MSAGTIPHVEVMIQGLKTIVQAAVSDQVAGFGEAAKVAVEKAVKEFDFEKELEEEVERELAYLKRQVASVIRDEFSREVRWHLQEALQQRRPEIEKLLEGLAEECFASFSDRIKLGEM